MGRRSLVRRIATLPALAVCLVLVGCGDKATPVPTPQNQVGEVSFTSEDGVVLTGRLFGLGPAPRSQVGVVLSHMFPADQSSWWGFAQVLADSGYLALTFDFRSYGESGGDKDDLGMADKDVEAALRFVRGLGPSTVFLAGASMGGTASLKVAARESVAGVISLSAPIEFRGISLKGERVQVPTLLMATSGDRRHEASLETMLEDGIVREDAESVVYEEGSDHGTRILEGKNGDAARATILAFLEAPTP